MNLSEQTMLNVELAASATTHELGLPARDVTVLEWAVEFAKRLLASEPQPKLVGHQRRHKYEPLAQWQPCSDHEATDFWDKTPGHEYREIYALNSCEMHVSDSDQEAMHCSMMEMATMVAENQKDAQDALRYRALKTEFHPLGVFLVHDGNGGVIRGSLLDKLSDEFIANANTGA